MKPVKCNFKNITTDDKVDFKKSQCLLLISVGQESHEGDRFSSTIDLVNNSFESCIISLYDTIQRYTMALNSKETPEYFHSISRKEGDLWIERNSNYLNKLSIPKKVFRWDTWINHPDFLKQRNKLLDLMQSDPSYKNVFDITIDKYLERYCKNADSLTHFDIDKAKKLCFDYVLEECVVLCLWSELNCKFEVYPNIHNTAIEETRRKIVHAGNKNLLNSLTVRFRNAKQLKPQTFTTLENKGVLKPKTTENDRE